MNGENATTFSLRAPFKIPISSNTYEQHTYIHLHTYILNIAHPFDVAGQVGVVKTVNRFQISIYTGFRIRLRRSFEVKVTNDFSTGFIVFILKNLFF